MIDRELEFLAYLLREPTQVKTTLVRPEHFGDIRCSEVFSAMKSLENGLITATEINRVLKAKGEDRAEFLAGIMGLMPDSVDPSAVDYLAAKIIEESWRVKTVQGVKQGLAKLTKEGNITEGLETLSAALISAQQGIMGQANPEISSILDGNHGNLFGKRFGFSYEDLQLSTRGFREGQVINFNAGYKSYKTRTVINLMIDLLRSGASVSYQTLEDNAGALSEKFIAALTGIHEQDIEMYYEPDAPSHLKNALQSQVEQAEEWLKAQPLRIYDQRHDVHNPNTLRSRILADKMRYGTNIVVIDHINQFGDEPEVLGPIYRSLVPLAQDAQVVMIGLSQQSNQSMMMGTNTNMLATRGTGVGGAVVHFGFELHKPSKGEGWLEILDESMAAKLQTETDFKIMKGDAYQEIGLHLKVLRRGRQTKFWCLFEPTSGKLVAIRSDRNGSSGFTGWDWESKK